VPVVYLVDDDPSVLKAVTRLLQVEGFTAKPYSSPQAFLDDFDPNVPGCIVMDLSMPEINGLDLQNHLAIYGHARPIVFITGHGDIPSSVKAMKAGAIDFLTKPFSPHDLLGAVRRAIERDEQVRLSRNERVQVETRLASLTSRERQVFDRVVKGRLNKQIAGELGIVEKTVKVHRGRVMKKMKAESLAALVQLANLLKPTTET
jgi:FixJ family two-component response regulator